LRPRCFPLFLTASRLILPSDRGPCPSSEQDKAPIGKRVTAIDYPDDRLAIRYRGVELAYHTFDKLRQSTKGAIADNKRLGAVLAMIARSSCAVNPGGAVGTGGVIKAPPVSSRSAELCKSRDRGRRGLSQCSFKR
jgi:hypothetical protein